jgi:hypothetical protein
MHRILNEGRTGHQFSDKSGWHLERQLRFFDSLRVTDATALGKLFFAGTLVTKEKATC